MAGTWRVAIDAIEDLGNSRYRMGDLTKKLVSTVKRSDEQPEMKHVIIEACVGDNVQRSRAFDVQDTESVRVDQVLFVQKPAPSQRLVLRVVKAHKVQKDALIGEAEVKAASGPMRLELERGKKARGTLVVSVTEGIPDRSLAVPSPKPPARSTGRLPPTGTVSGGDSGVAQLTPRSVQSFLTSTGMSPGSTVGRPSPYLTPAARSQPPRSSAAAAATCWWGCWDGILDMLGAGGVEAAGRRFLAAKVREEGVLRLRSGLMYKVLRRGDGRRHPAKDSPCECHYRGLLVNGREFDASKAGKPVTFTPNQVIKGWAEALQLMVEGDRWELYVPPSLGYGDKGAGGVIPSGATLVFQIELVRIKGRAGP